MADNQNLDLVISGQSIRTSRHFVRKVNDVDLDNILQHFNEEIQEIKGLSGIADALLADRDKKGKEDRKKQAEQIMRAQIVFLVSALDYYMHELTRVGCDKMFKGHWSRSTGYPSFRVSLIYAEQAIGTGYGMGWLHRGVIDSYKRTTMGSFDGIEKQLKLLNISLKNVAHKVFRHPSGPEESVESMRTSLDQLYDNRNIVAHQAGKSHEEGRIFKPTRRETDNYIERIAAIVTAIDGEARKRKSETAEKEEKELQAGK